MIFETVFCGQDEIAARRSEEAGSDGNNSTANNLCRMTPEVKAGIRLFPL